jgi:hypothetical protein
MKDLGYLKYIKRVGFLVMFLLVLVSCKSTKTGSNGEVDGALTTKRIIENHYKDGLNFTTLNGRIKIDYSDGKTSKGVTVGFRMKKDEVIWISAPFGMVKAYITPEKVSFYNKLEGEYFEGDYSYLSSLLGNDLDFEKLQNVLMGQALLDLRDQKYYSQVNDKGYELTPKKLPSTLKALFLIEPKYFKISEQQITQPFEKRHLQVMYDYQELDKAIIPNKVSILAVENKSENNITLEYRGIELDKKLNFPYKIPKGFKEIILTK